MRAVIVALIASFASLAMAGPIKFLGLDFTMTIEQQTQVLKDRGYTCVDDDYEGKKSATCTKEDGAEVSIDKDNLYFNCESFNGCKYKLQEVAESVFKSGLVSHLDSREWGLCDSCIKLEGEYSGRGPDGDLVLVSGSLKGGDAKVQLMRGAFGDTMSFD